MSSEVGKKKARIRRRISRRLKLMYGVDNRWSNCYEEDINALLELFTEARATAVAETWDAAERIVNDLEFGDLVTKGIAIRRFRKAKGEPECPKCQMYF